MENWDYIILGAGSAGCALAEGLSRDGRSRVLVLEAGGSDFNPWIKMPVGYGRTFYDERVNWKLESEAETALGGRKGYWPRGKVLGGSSSINALVYFRGLPGDFDDWEAAGAAGWGWKDVKPWFEAMETRTAPDGSKQGSGPLTVSDVSDRLHRANRHFLSAARAAQLPDRDFNEGDGEGIGFYRISARNGRRCSAADAFLRPALKRSNVRLITRARALRILFEGRRAIGVRIAAPAGEQEFRASREVIVSTGSVHSPQLLQLSGIGPAAHLNSLGVQVVHDLPAVGSNLQDHLAVNYTYKASEPTLNNQLSPWWGKLLAGIAYVLARKGPLANSVNQAGGFVRSRPGLSRPDTQLYFTPATYSTAPEGKRPLINPDPFAGFLISFQPARPKSRGSIMAKSPDISVQPSIRPNSLSHPDDLADVISGGRLIQRLMADPALSGLVAGKLGPDVRDMDDAGILEDFRQRCGTVFHPVSTCRMGERPEESVVDAKLRVHGVDGLRVADASVFPNVTSGNTNSPTMMLGMRAAALILEDRK
jgi:choline dehydrogenase